MCQLVQVGCSVPFPVEFCQKIRLFDFEKAHFRLTWPSDIGTVTATLTTMRWLFLLLLGLIASACGLSFNPDLPSGMESDGTSDDSESSTGDGDTGSPDDGGIGISPPSNSDATGGAGGAGGATSEH